MAKSSEMLEAEVAALRDRSDERMETVNARIRSVHDGVGALRGRAEENATNISNLRTELQGIRQDIKDVSDDISAMETRFNKGLEDMKEEWSSWIEGLGVKFKWTAGFLVPLILGVLALVLR